MVTDLVILDLILETLRVVVDLIDIFLVLMTSLYNSFVSPKCCFVDAFFLVV